MILKRCDLYNFANKLKGRKIACYGIGKEFEDIINSYQDYEWEGSVKYLIDNNPAKWGKEYNIHGSTIRVSGLNSIECEGDREIVIMPTCAAFSEIICYLNEIKWLKDVECYVFHCMFNLSEGRLHNIRQTDEIRIPAIIHYCWFGGNPLPDKYKKYIESWKRFCPEYEIKEWNETNLDVNETTYTREAYGAGKYGFVPDYFRLKIIYENGGIYLDTDVELIRNLDDLRYNEAFCGMEYPGRVAFGLGFGAEKHNKIIEKLMDYYKKNQFISEKGTCDVTPSPNIQTKTLSDMGMRKSAKFQCFNGMSIYPTDVMSPKNPYTGELIITDNTYAIHHFDGTWLTDAGKDDRRKKMKKASELLTKFS